MALVLIFLLGIGNFAMHKAVLESGHPLVDAIPPVLRRNGGRLSLIVEFVMLLGSMAMVSEGAVSWAWGYGAYSLSNAAAAWFVLGRRV